MPAIRRAEEKDRAAILAAAQDVGVFTNDEVACVDELLDVYLHKPGQQDYVFLVRCDEQNHPLGFSCHGPTPMTEGTFDLYWLCVSSHAQGKGIASALLDGVVQELCAQGGRLLVLETSSTPPYRPARAFYEKHGFDRRTGIPDYYRPGDDLVMYAKYLVSSHPRRGGMDAEYGSLPRRGGMEYLETARQATESKGD